MFRCRALLCSFMFAFGIHHAVAQQEQAKPMDPQVHPTFEIATIKLSDPDKHNSGFHTNGTRLFFENQTMLDVMSFAYSVNRNQIVNAPDWFESKHFDIRGTADQPGIPNITQQQEMLRSLLEERFSMKLHHDQREMQRVVITVAHGGPKLAPTTSTEFLPDLSCNGGSSIRDCKFVAISMDLFAEGMRFFVNRPVINQTGLDGKYDFHLKWTPDDAPTSTDSNAPPSLYTAMPEQIGLKAEASKGPTDVLVIDHAEPPSEN
jgi:uncharacterized protein (TIGR03435 family)